MIRTTLIASAAVLCFAPFAQADHNSRFGYDDGYQRQVTQRSSCENEKDNNRLVGGLIGAVAGGVLGVALTNDNDDDYRGRNNYGRRGYGRHRGYGHHGYGRRRGNDDDEIAGALIGGVLGAVIGSEIAGSSTDCHTTGNRYNYTNVAPPTRQAFAPSRVYSASAGPSYSNTAPATYPAQEQPLYGGPTEAQVQQQPIRITRTTPTQPAQVYAPQCQTVQRETRLPNGEMVREPVSVCQTTDGNWQIQANQADQTGQTGY